MDRPPNGNSWERWRGEVSSKLDQLQKTFEDMRTGKLPCVVDQRLSRFQSQVWRILLIGMMGLLTSIVLWAMDRM